MNKIKLKFCSIATCLYHSLGVVSRRGDVLPFERPLYQLLSFVLITLPFGDLHRLRGLFCAPASLFCCRMVPVPMVGGRLNGIASAWRCERASGAVSAATGRSCETGPAPVRMYAHSPGFRWSSDFPASDALLGRVAGSHCMPAPGLLQKFFQ